MKGLILAGGFATRLRPLSCSKPKLLFPLVGVPLIDHLVEGMRKAKIREVILAVNHLSDKLRMEVAARKLGEQIILSVEENPLGTGGPLRLAAPILNKDEPVVVVNGDVVSDIDLDFLIAAHRRSKAQATMAVVSVPNPRSFGLVTLDSDDRIIGFEEKSSGPVGPSWINAGVYVLDYEVIHRIASGRPVSLEREIFPVLAKQMKLAGYRHSGFWYDIGTIQDYVVANKEMLNKPQALVVKNLAGFKARMGMELPSYVGSSSVIETGATVGPYAILSDKVQVRAGALVRDTIVFEETSIGKNCYVEGSLIGEGATIGNGAKIGKGCMIAGEVVVAEGTVVNPGSTILN